ncbi:hypothetical protein ACQWF4_22660, partial [Salmonella enterica subsp. enterica serovar Infantis]
PEVDVGVHAERGLSTGQTGNLMMIVEGILMASAAWDAHCMIALYAKSGHDPGEYILAVARQLLGFFVHMLL